MKPIFCGNFDYDARQYDLERLFRKFGKVDRVDMKSGFAFVYMDDERDAEDAIRGLDRFEFGRKGRRLRVEWTKQERGFRKPGNSGRRSSTTSRPSKTLFVINFDPYHTRTKDLERHFDPYGKILNVRIRRNFAFIQYESEDDATRALDATNMSKLMDRVISVEYAIKDDDERQNGYSPDRGRDRSPGRRGHDRGRSPSPYRRERASPDYGRGRSPIPYRRERASPDYGRGPNLSPYQKERSKERSHSDYDRRRSRSPRRERPSPDHGRERNPRERVTPDYGSGRSPSPKRERISSDDYRRGRSPQRERVSPDDYRRSPSPQKERVSPDDYRRSPSPQRERISPDDYQRSLSPQREMNSPDDYRRGPSPDSKPTPMDSPNYNGAESPMEERYRSRSPLERERSRSRS